MYGERGYNAVRGRTLRDIAKNAHINSNKRSTGHLKGNPLKENINIIKDIEYE